MMRRYLFSLILALVLIFFSILLGCSNDDNSTGSDNSILTSTVTDIDGNIYKTVKIGNQWWMAENLKVTHYRNGNPIPNVTDIMDWIVLNTGAYCNYRNSEDNANIYGRLYNWYVINDNRNIAPEGWHVSTDEDWKQLETYLGMNQDEVDSISWRGTNEGGKLKEAGTEHWSSPNTGATNTTGFTAIPSGFRYDYNYTGGIDSYAHLSIYALYWASSEINSDSIFRRDIYYKSSSIHRYPIRKNAGISIRCVKDQ